MYYRSEGSSYSWCLSDLIFSYSYFLIIIIILNIIKRIDIILGIINIIRYIKDKEGESLFSRSSNKTNNNITLILTSLWLPEDLLYYGFIFNYLYLLVLLGKMTTIH